MKAEHLKQWLARVIAEENNPEGREGADNMRIKFRGDAMDEQDAKWYNMLQDPPPPVSPLPSHVSGDALAVSSVSGTKRSNPSLHADRTPKRFVSSQPRERFRDFPDHSCSEPDVAVPQSGSSEACPLNQCSVHHTSTLLTKGYPADHG